VLNVRLNMGTRGSASYYTFSPHPDIVMVVLDGYDVSLLGWPPGHPLHTQAQAILDARNPNQAHLIWLALHSMRCLLH
jgi:manganese-dependent ADP-ribose/CDP-alcohol diphosphatase